MLRTVLLFAISAPLVFSACKKQETPTADGVKVLSWTRAGYAGNAITDAGADVTDGRDLTIVFVDGTTARIALKIIHGHADVAFKDGSKADREVPRRMEATMLDASPLAISVSCSADVSGPAEPKPTALYTACTITASSTPQGPERRAVVTVFGDGEVQTDPAAPAMVTVKPSKS